MLLGLLLHLLPIDRTLTVDTSTGGYTIQDSSLAEGPKMIMVVPKVSDPHVKAPHGYMDRDFNR